MVEGDYNYRMQNEIKKMDAQRKEALSSQDAAKYTRLCNELGMEPEDKYLYEVGELELQLQSDK